MHTIITALIPTLGVLALGWLANRQLSPLIAAMFEKRVVDTASKTDDLVYSWVKTAVSLAEEAAYQYEQNNPRAQLAGEAKQTLALDFVNQQLKQHRLSVPDGLLRQALDAAVQDAKWGDRREKTRQKLWAAEDKLEALLAPQATQEDS